MKNLTIVENNSVIYIKKCKRNTSSRKLVETAIKELKHLGYNTMIIASLKGNPINEFYKRIGDIYIKDVIYTRLNLSEKNIIMKYIKLIKLIIVT